MLIERRTFEQELRDLELASAPRFVGLVNQPADPFPEGYDKVRIRADLAESYRAVLETVRALGGILPSSGALRYLDAEVTASRSSTSLHYLGRAFDLHTRSGMQGVTDPLIVLRAGGTDSNPMWEVFGKSISPREEHPAYNARRIKESELEALLWRLGRDPSRVRRRGRFFSITAIFRDHGWHPIPARSNWRTTYNSTEWWHFENRRGLVEGRTTFGDELRAAWPGEQVSRSGLKLDAVWRGSSFS